MLWRERKRLWCGLPWTFTVYSFDEERIFIDSGLFTQVNNEVRLYRIMDLSSTRSLIQRIFGLGTLHFRSADKTLGDFDFVNIRNVKEVKEQLSHLIEAQRDNKRIGMREYMSEAIEESDDTVF